MRETINELRRDPDLSLRLCSLNFFSRTTAELLDSNANESMQEDFEDMPELLDEPPEVSGTQRYWLAVQWLAQIRSALRATSTLLLDRPNDISELLEYESYKIGYLEQIVQAQATATRIEEGHMEDEMSAKERKKQTTNKIERAMEVYKDLTWGFCQGIVTEARYVIYLYDTQ